MKNTTTFQGTNLEQITERSHAMNKIMTIERFYLTNHDFEVYVNKNIQTYGRTLNEELSNVITVEYYRSLQKGGCNEKQVDGEENN